MTKPVTFNDLSIIKYMYLDVFFVNYNMTRLIVKKTCKTKKNQNISITKSRK